MLLNQAEARTKWCPMVRQPLPVANGPSGITIGAAAGNVRQYGTERPLCVASSCAMWRWSGDGITGYCGLAGIPAQVL